MIEAEILGDNDEDILVFGEYVKAERGSRGDYGVPMEPDIPAHIEVEPYGKLEDGSEVELTQAQLERAEEHLWDEMKNEAFNDEYSR